MSSLRAGPATLVPLLGLALALALVLGGCDSGDGRTLRTPAPGATAPPIPTSSTATTAVLGTQPPVGSGETQPFALTSPSFADGAAIPARHSSCDGEDLSPALSWTSVPQGTVELALTVIDPDAPGGPFVHQVVTGIDPVVTGLGEGGVPESAVEVQPWIGPCPPAGETHGYVFTLFALTAATGVEVGAGVEEARAALESTPGPTAVLTGTYGRPADA